MVIFHSKMLVYQRVHHWMGRFILEFCFCHGEKKTSTTKRRCGLPKLDHALIKCFFGNPQVKIGKLNPPKLVTKYIFLVVAIIGIMWNYTLYIIYNGQVQYRILLQMGYATLHVLGKHEHKLLMCILYIHIYMYD